MNSSVKKGIFYIGLYLFVYLPFTILIALSCLGFDIEFTVIEYLGAFMLSFMMLNNIGVGMNVYRMIAREEENNVHMGP